MSDSLRPHGLYSPWNSPGQNTGVGSLSLLQAIFPTQGLNPGLPHWRWILYQLSHKGSTRILEWVDCPFSRSSQPRNRMRLGWALPSMKGILIKRVNLDTNTNSLWLFATLWTINHQAPLSMGFPRQKYWSELPFLSPGYLPNPRIEPVFRVLASRFFTIEPPGKPTV